MWHQEKWWFSIKNIFDFFSGEKNLYVKPSWKLFFKTCFLFHVWNRIETKWKFLCENKKNFFEWKLIFHEQDQQNVCISTCETPNPKKLYFKENIFFFSSKKNLCSAEKAFYVWNRNKTFFSTVKPRESMFWTCETKKPFFQEKNVLFFLMCYNFFSMCETKRNYVFPLVKAKTFFFFFFKLLWNKVKTFFQDRNFFFFFFTVLNQHYYHLSFMFLSAVKLFLILTRTTIITL